VHAEFLFITDIIEGKEIEKLLDEFEQTGVVIVAF